MLNFSPLSGRSISGLLSLPIVTPLIVCYAAVSDQLAFGVPQPQAQFTIPVPVNQYSINNLIQLSVTFTALVTGIPVDPQTVTLYVRAPDGSITEYTYASGQITRDSTGVYHCNIQNGEAGLYNYQFEGAGNMVCESFSQFNSVPSPFGNL